MKSCPALLKIFLQRDSLHLPATRKNFQVESASTLLKINLLLSSQNFYFRKFFSASIFPKILKCCKIFLCWIEINFIAVWVNLDFFMQSLLICWYVWFCCFLCFLLLGSLCKNWCFFDMSAWELDLNMRIAWFRWNSFP